MTNMSLLFIQFQVFSEQSLLRNEKQNKIYLVKAITTPLEEIIKEFSLIKTAILPFRGQIICDGLFEKHNILIGPNMMKELKEEIKEKRKHNEIIKEIQPNNHSSGWLTATADFGRYASN